MVQIITIKVFAIGFCKSLQTKTFVFYYMFHVNDFINQKHEKMIKNDKTYSVYMHKCPNGMIYVGCTSLKPSRRWNGGKGYYGNPVFEPLIREYGWDSIRHITVASGLTRDAALYLEGRLLHFAKEDCVINTLKTNWFTSPKYDAKYTTPIFKRDDVVEFYGNSLNTEFVESELFSSNSTKSFSQGDSQTTATNSINFYGETTTKTNKSMKKVKKETKRSCRLSGVKIELMFDNRYKRGDDTYPVCVRVYNNKKYVYLQTGYSMTPYEFECMDTDNENCLNKMYEKVCQYVREKTVDGMFCIDCVKSELEKKMQGINNTSGTLASLIMERAETLTNLGSIRNYKSASAIVEKAHPNGLPLATVSQHTVGEIVKCMQSNGYSPTTINIYLSIIRASINYGIYKGYLKPEQYPFKRQAMEVDKVVVPKSNKRDDRYITKQEMQQLWGWFKRTKNKWVGYFMFSYLHGGINLADMVDLRFNDFWFNEGGFVFTRKKTAHKTNRKVAVPATTWTQELFDTLNIEPTKNKRVFAGLEYDGTDADYQRLKSGVHTNIDRSLAKACKELEINKKVTMTTARHSFATIATKEGIPYVMVENAMGHTLGSVASHYIGSFSVEEMRPDFEKLL